MALVIWAVFLTDRMRWRMSRGLGMTQKSEIRRPKSEGRNPK
jgi:hypothetical protein